MAKEQNIALVFFIVGGLVIFVIGCGSGIMFEKSVQSKDKAIQQAIKFEPTAKILGSNAVQSIQVSGQVEKITGNNILMTYLGSEMVINSDSNTKIYTLGGQTDLKTGKTTFTPKQISFSDIKVGETINPALKILPSGQLECISIFVSPTANATQSNK